MGTGKLYRWEFEKRGQAVLIDAPGSLTLDESGLMLEPALAGAGLAYIGESSAAEHIAAGRLEVVLVDWTPPYPGLSLYFAGRRHIPARLRALIDLIREQATQQDSGDALQLGRGGFWSCSRVLLSSFGLPGACRDDPLKRRSARCPSTRRTVRNRELAFPL
jgi:hypothetical protein